jgi:hypothetical protein
MSGSGGRKKRRKGQNSAVDDVTNVLNLSFPDSASSGMEEDSTVSKAFRMAKENLMGSAQGKRSDDDNNTFRGFPSANNVWGGGGSRSAVGGTTTTRPVGTGEAPSYARFVYLKSTDPVGHLNPSRLLVYRRLLTLSVMALSSLPDFVNLVVSL